MAARSIDKGFCQCRHGLRIFKAAVRPSRASCSFSTSSSRKAQAELPQFTQTSSTELNNLLPSIRQHIFIPRRLTHQHRNLIYHKRNWALLTNDPINVDIGSESVRLVPADRNKDVPHPWRAMSDFLRLMDPDDGATWRANFPQLMLGFRDAGVRWTTEQLAKIIRRAGEAGMAPTLLHLAKQADNSGVRVRDLRAAREAMWACRMYALKDRWSKNATAAAARYAIQMAETLEMPYQLGGAAFGEQDARIQPDMIAVVAELVAADAALHHKCQDPDGKVKQYFERMMSNIDKGASMDLGLDNESIDPRVFDEQLTRLVPIRNAVLLSHKVLGSELPQKEKALSKMEEYDKILQDARGILRMQGLRDKKQVSNLPRTDRRSTRWNHLSKMFKKPIDGEKH